MRLARESRVGLRPPGVHNGFVVVESLRFRMYGLRGVGSRILNLWVRAFDRVKSLSGILWS